MRHSKDWYYTLEHAKNLIGQEVELERLEHITDNTVIASDIRRKKDKSTGEWIDYGILRYVGLRDTEETESMFKMYGADGSPIFSFYLPHERYDEKTGKILSGRLYF